MKDLFSAYGKPLLSLLLVCTLVVTVLSSGLVVPTAYAADLTIDISRSAATRSGSNESFTVEDDNGTIWGTDTEVDIFRVEYENDRQEITVAGEKGQKVIAPGTENIYTFALKNNDNGYVDYQMTMEAWFTTPEGVDVVIPVEARVQGSDWLLGSETEYRPVLELSQVEDSATLDPGKHATYSLQWQWPFERDLDGDGDVSDGDAEDTWLGNFEEELSLTIKITVNSTYNYPSSNKPAVTAPVPEWLNDKDHIAYLYGYPDGTVQPESNITRAEVSAIFFRLLKEQVREEYRTDNHPYTDIPADAWYRTEVATLSAMGVLEGYPDGTFRGNNTITRAEMAAVLARLSQATVQTKGRTNFNDISGHWAENAIKTIEGFRWIVGYPDGTFRPDKPITRAETATMVNRVLHRLPEYEDDLLEEMKRWPDNADPEMWYYLAIQEATNSHDYRRLLGTREKWTDLNETKIID